MYIKLAFALFELLFVYCDYKAPLLMTIFYKPSLSPNFNSPNGALTFCMEFLEKNIEWLLDQISKFEDHYIIIDMPGITTIY